MNELWQLRDLRTLVAEDELLISQLVREILVTLECTVIWPACSRDETLWAIRTNSIDNPLLDVQLHEASIYPAIEKLVRRIPFMLVTGQGNLGRPQALLANVPILAKPLRLQQLENMMSTTFHLQDRGAHYQP